MNLTGKTALVTGGSRGIGRAICLKLASGGANLLINYAGNEEEANKTRLMCEEQGVKAVLFRADVSKYEECEKMFDFCADQLGAPEILVNNAGMTRDKLLLRMSPEDFDRVIDVNLKGSFNCIKLACKAMSRARWGRIVNISSVVGEMGNAGQANYAASKAGILGLTKSAARELAKRGVTVNAVAPGFIETDMTDALSQDIREQMKTTIPMGRFGAPEDIAEAAAFLCGDGAAYITGQTLHVNGGMWM